MRRRLLGCYALIVTAALVHHLAAPVIAGTHTTTNFMVTAPSDDIARRVAKCAEYWRRELAIQWLGQTLPNWYRPCPITVKVGQIGASGQTTFTFENGEVHGWKMHVQGTLERILDSVVPHEVNHTIFASHFRRPLPRWADEGAATLFEHESEQARQLEIIKEVFHTSRRIPLRNLLAIREYPSDMRDVLTLYAEGYSLASYLVGIKGAEGRRIYLRFLDDAHRSGWEQAVARNYGIQSLEDLEQQWTGWINAGSPGFQQEIPTQVAVVSQAAPASEATQAAAQVEMPASDAPDATIYRSQSPQNQAEATPPQYTAAREVGPLHSIPRLLRVSQAENHTDNVTQSQGEKGRPAGIRPNSSLVPTTEGIKTNSDAPNYQFPSARRQ
ncbi:hypothetical protein [Planctomicrobium sp. SH527]|uniref:hypothetical protein n=1 Tax=Planctomicrobium sp. SH527 TaxID=3448123 RepID=UPI003F5C01F2